MLPQLFIVQSYCSPVNVNQFMYDVVGVRRYAQDGIALRQSANDGIISIASLIVGVAAAAGSRGEIMTAAVAGWAAGAMSMAAGEYVSVSSQADSEAADLEREQRALRERPAEEKEELAHIYEERGLKPKLAKQVAGQLMAKDALDAHARDELGLNEAAKPNPIQAAWASAVSFSVGAALPTLAAFLAPPGAVAIVVSAASLIFLVALGAVGAKAGGAPIVRPALRVGFWGALAMAVTAGIGALVGRAV
jgi:vacuolar iron transporter family protein